MDGETLQFQAGAYDLFRCSDDVHCIYEHPSFKNGHVQMVSVAFEQQHREVKLDTIVRAYKNNWGLLGYHW